MAEAVDYFSNHALKLRFPWRLYHRPIIRTLAAALAAAPGPEVLNVGSGPFLERSALPPGPWRFTLCDVDARAIDAARRLHGDTLAGADVVGEGAPLPYPDARFDLVVAMDVIEHVPEPAPWLAELARVLRPGGHLFLTTPNYGSHSLRLIEATALELIARAQGFTRSGLHPSRFDPRRLERALDEAGLGARSVRTTSLGWVLVGEAHKRR
ncbi:MAG: class I SAM-dependent methyltransferase [Myxococcaceae bacterium]